MMHSRPVNDAVTVIPATGNMDVTLGEGLSYRLWVLHVGLSVLTGIQSRSTVSTAVLCTCHVSVSVALSTRHSSQRAAISFV